ncbi:hypothetical protein AWC22_25105 [Mycobacterium riyadhense]|uniref:Transposase n=1 Tax=Mycobacterium riyadhense TaxID=486698 RepID=A0A1X2C3H7_9MYCO|nr:hypothetical protein AWC22_25105 [Mycobacterium riyadhense]
MEPAAVKHEMKQTLAAIKAVVEWQYARLATQPRRNVQAKSGFRRDRVWDRPRYVVRGLRWTLGQLGAVKLIRD